MSLPDALFTLERSDGLPRLLNIDHDDDDDMPITITQCVVVSCGDCGLPAPPCSTPDCPETSHRCLVRHWMFTMCYECQTSRPFVSHFVGPTTRFVNSPQNANSHGPTCKDGGQVDCEVSLVNVQTGPGQLTQTSDAADPDGMARTSPNLHGTPGKNPATGVSLLAVSNTAHNPHSVKVASTLH